MSADWTELQRVLEDAGDDLSAVTGVVGYGLAIDESKPIVQVFATEPLSESAHRELDRLLGDRYTVVAGGPFKAQ